MPLIVAVDSLLLALGFLDYAQELQTRFAEQEEVSLFAHEVQHQLKLDPQIAVPRYLEVKL